MTTQTGPRLPLPITLRAIEAGVPVKIDWWHSDSRDAVPGSAIAEMAFGNLFMSASIEPLQLIEGLLLWVVTDEESDDPLSHGIATSLAEAQDAAEAMARHIALERLETVFD